MSTINRALLVIVVCLSLVGLPIWGQTSFANQTSFSAGSSSFNPASIATLMYEGSCITFSGTCQTPSNGATLSTWYDQSTNANAGTWVGTSPIYAASVAGLNGQGAANITGSSALNFTSISFSTSISIYYVYCPTTAAANQTFFAGQSGSGFLSFGINSSGTQEADVDAVVHLGVGSTTLSNGACHTFGLDYNASTGAGQFWLDGSADGSGFTQTASVSSGNNRIANDAGSNQQAGYLGAGYVFSPQLSSGNTTAMHSYTSTKYGH